MKRAIIFLGVVLVVACKKSSLPVIAPDIISEKTPYDSDDPAIWIHPHDASKSLVFGTDKDTDGGVYAFNLQGQIVEDKSIRNIQRPNNVDIEYGFKINDSITEDVLVFTEREKNQIRVFSVPDMRPLDNGGFKVFKDAKIPDYKSPMGVALYKSPNTNKLFAIIGRKGGPSPGYLHQYELVSENGIAKLTLVREFGKFSGKKEIEAIAVDDALGYVYYSDEGQCIRKYNAEPSKGNEELACFGQEFFLEDIEGIAIAAYENGAGHIIVSNQQKGEFNVFSRATNTFEKAVNLGTTETDGCEVVTVPLGEAFPNGLFVAMNDDRDFYFYDLDRVLK